MKTISCFPKVTYLYNSCITLIAMWKIRLKFRLTEFETPTTSSFSDVTAVREGGLHYTFP